MTITNIKGSVDPHANVYFDGKCVSHTIETPEGKKISVGVILPASLLFNTGAPEKMELIEGECRVKPKGSDSWTSYTGGQSFDVPGNSSFDIEVSKTLHYICHFG